MHIIYINKLFEWASLTKYVKFLLKKKTVETVENKTFYKICKIFTEKHTLDNKTLYNLLFRITRNSHVRFNKLHRYDFLTLTLLKPTVISFCRAV